MVEWKMDLPTLYPGLSAGPYDYAVLVDELPVGDLTCESYGVAAVLRATGERAEVHHITVSTERIDELMSLLVRSQVSPIHLRDVVDDWL